MLCDNCKKNQAAVYIEQVSGSEKAELNLCYKCSLDIQAPLSLNNILKGILFGIKTETINTTNCPSCNLKLIEFRKSGKLGCSQCYPTFKKELDVILKNIQWGVEHRGKIPKKNAANLILKKEIQNLRKELTQAIELEKYEEAARIRDQIKAIVIKKEGTQ